MLNNFRYYGTDCYTPEIIVCHSFRSAVFRLRYWNNIRSDKRKLA